LKGLPSGSGWIGLARDSIFDELLYKGAVNIR